MKVVDVVKLPSGEVIILRRGGEKLAKALGGVATQKRVYDDPEEFNEYTHRIDETKRA